MVRDVEEADVKWTEEEDAVLLKAVKQAQYRVYSNENQLGAYVSRQLLHKNMHQCTNLCSRCMFRMLNSTHVWLTC